MKNVVLIVAYIVIAALTFGIVMTVHGREARSMELESSLSSIVEETVENAMLGNNYGIENDSFFLADFIENLAGTLETESDITVKIMKADAEKGIMSVEVEEGYRHLNGKEGSVKCSKTVILNRLMEEPENHYEVRFYMTREDMQNGGDCYKVYTIKEGDSIKAPAEPKQEGAWFDGWKDVNGYLADFTQPVTEERIYYAEWN